MANKHRTDVEYDMAVEYPMLKISGYYKAVSFHRNGTPDKSQWIISVDDEFDLFAKTKLDGQIYDDKGYVTRTCPLSPKKLLRKLQHTTKRLDK